MTVQIPTVHLGGTPYERLLEQNVDAMHALTEALGALRRATPDGRDFYPQGNEAGVKARQDHMERIAKIQSVFDDLQAIAMGITDQEPS